MFSFDTNFTQNVSYKSLFCRHFDRVVIKCAWAACDVSYKSLSNVKSFNSAFCEFLTFFLNCSLSLNIQLGIILKSMDYREVL